MTKMQFRKKHVPRRRGDDEGLKPGQSVTQTVKRDGKRVVIKQTMKSDGTISTRVNAAHTLESELQAAQVAALRALPDYGVRFLIAGDQNAAKRGPVAQLEAKRTGMTPGEPDLRIYIKGGELLLIENKNGGYYLSQEQKDRHVALEDLGFPVWTIKTDDCDRAADCAVAILRYTQGDVRNEPGPSSYPEISRYAENIG